jgi:hypothetical protein
MALLSSLNPLRCSGTKLPPNLLLAAKLIALPLLWFNAPGGIPEPFLPFLSIFDRIGHPALVQGALRIAAYIGAIGIALNQAVRLSCILLGGAMMLSILSCRGSYYNNAVFYSLVLILIGLEGKERSESKGAIPIHAPSLLRLQVVLVYAGAGLDKLLDHDWWSGQFFENWTLIIQQTLYLKLKALFPSMVLSRIVSAMTIATELGLAVSLLIPRWSLIAVRVGVVFHTALSFFIGNTFGFFYFAILASYLAFVPWPTGRVEVFYDETRELGVFVKKLIATLDFDDRFAWIPLGASREAAPPLGAPASWLHVRMKGRAYAGAAAVRMILMAQPVTYLLLMALVSIGLTRGLESTWFAYVAMSLVLALFVPPCGGATERGAPARIV